MISESTPQRGVRWCSRIHSKMEWGARTAAAGTASPARPRVLNIQSWTMSEQTTVPRTTPKIHRWFWMRVRLTQSKRTQLRLRWYNVVIHTVPVERSIRRWWLFVVPSTGSDWVVHNQGEQERPVALGIAQPQKCWEPHLCTWTWMWMCSTLQCHHITV